jgi:hypothetical protein
MFIIPLKIILPIGIYFILPNFTKIGKVYFYLIVLRQGKQGHTYKCNIVYMHSYLVMMDFFELWFMTKY